jgi:hypothetical protein
MCDDIPIVGPIINALTGGGGGSSDVVYLPSPSTPKTSDASVEEAAAKERALARKRNGRKATILTSMATNDSGQQTLLGQ